jgi:hypothetical protein
MLFIESISDFIVLAIESIIPCVKPAGAELEAELETELLTEEETDFALEDDEDFTAGFDAADAFGGVTFTFTGSLLIIRASVVQRPGTMPSSSDVQCSMPTQSLGE